MCYNNCGYCITSLLHLNLKVLKSTGICDFFGEIKFMYNLLTFSKDYKLKCHHVSHTRIWKKYYPSCHICVFHLAWHIKGCVSFIDDLFKYLWWKEGWVLLPLFQFISHFSLLLNYLNLAKFIENASISRHQCSFIKFSLKYCLDSAFIWTCRC